MLLFSCSSIISRSSAGHRIDLGHPNQCYRPAWMVLDAFAFKLTPIAHIDVNSINTDIFFVWSM